MDEYAFIRMAHFRFKKSARQISKETGLHRATIKKAINGETPKYKLLKKRRSRS